MVSSFHSSATLWLDYDKACGGMTMTSFYISYTVLGFIFYCVFYFRRNGDSDFSYPVSLVWVCYLLLRVLPFFFLQENRFNYLVLALMDLPVFLLLGFLLGRIYGARLKSYGQMHYLFTPFLSLCLGYGKALLLLCNLVLLFILLILIQELKNQKYSLFFFYPAWIILQAGAILLLYAVREQHQTFQQLISVDSIPMTLSLGLFLLGSALVLFILSCRYQTNLPEALLHKIPSDFVGSTAESGCVRGDFPQVHIRKQDIVHILLLTVLTFTLLSFRLGSHQAPASGCILSSEMGTDEITLTFEKSVSISRVYVFLGYESKRDFTFFSKANKTDAVTSSQETLTSPFAWNSVDIGQSLTELRLRSEEDEAQLLELILLDSDGHLVLPANAAQYPELFDEQALWPGTPTFYEQTMFDEVYHGRTAYEFLHGLPIYENTHPPLGKILISGGIALFGMNPFGWRIVNVLCGTLMIPFAYLWGLRLTGRRRFGLFSAILMMTGFQHFTLSRIATIDITVAVFLLAAFYFQYCFISTEKRRYLPLCGLALACALSTKWTGAYAALGIALVFFLWFFEKYLPLRKQAGIRKQVLQLTLICMVSFLVIPAVIYTLSYLPFTRVYPEQNLLQHVISNGQLMLRYHAHTVFEHPYASEWYDWILDRVPLLDSYTVLPDGRLSIVKTFLNPLIAWGGIPALLFCILRWRCRKDRQARTLVLFYLSMLLPWLFIHRTVFIYQYFGAALILIFCITYGISRLKRHQTRVLVLTGALSLALFALFYPVLSGLPVSGVYVRQLAWLSRW